VALAPATRLGAYEIVSLIGQGGMGEVYRAKDTKLGRDVALKILPATFTSDPDRVARFRREAQVLASLNHPHIAAIYGLDDADGTQFLVLELVDGESLDKRIARGKIPVDEALGLAKQIAEAIEAAHGKGIIHRDVKPANIARTRDGSIKVLDFGLAKATESPTGSSLDGTNSPTITTPAMMTDVGVILGTAAYMSPEQAKGRPADTRSDIWAFGCVLYEMLTARRAFAENSVTETLAAVLHRDPTPVGELIAGVPPDLERLITRCLKKDPSRRAQHMADVKVELLDLEEHSERPPAVQRVGASSSLKRRRWLLGITTLVFVVGAAWAAATWRTPSTAIRLVAVTTMAGNEATPSFSPDGESVAFSWEGESSGSQKQSRHIWSTLIGTSDNRQLTSGPDDDWSPCWSPDGRQVAFIRGPRGETGQGRLYVVSANGGAPRSLDFVTSAFSQLSWSPDSQWLAAPGYRVLNDESSKPGGIQLVPVGGGAPRPLTLPRDTGYDRHPAFTADGGRLAYASCEKEITPPCDVFITDLDSSLQPSGRVHRVTTVRMPIQGIAWAPDERSIVFAMATMSVWGTGLGSQLWRTSVTGATLPERIEEAPWGAYGPAIDRTRHRLVFAHDRTDMNILRFEGTNPAKPVVASSFVDYAPSFSPDGRRIAFESSRSGVAREIWVSDADGANALQVTRSPLDLQGQLRGTGNPNWSPKGDRIVYSGYDGKSTVGLYTINPDGSGRQQITDDSFLNALPTWSHDGRWIYYRQDRIDGHDIFRVASGGSGTPQRLTQAGGVYPIESFDGAWLLFSKSNAPSPVYAMPAAGGSEHLVIDCAQPRAFAVTPPNNFYYLGCPSDTGPFAIHRRDVTTGRDEVVGSINRSPRNSFLGLAVSPDNQSILYADLVAQGADLKMLENFR
jgi:serine/threonine protein kinase